MKHNSTIQKDFRKKTLLSTLSILVIAILSISCSSKALNIGDVMPDFKLKDYDGKEYSLSQYKGKIVVIEFCSQECPYSRGVDPDLISLHAKYSPKGVVFLGIDSHFKTTMEEIKKYALETKKPYPILKDAGNQYADKVEAKVTPEIFIIDKDGKIAYHGAFDDRKGPDGKPTEKYTENAIEALLAGKKIEKPETKAWGCTIKRAPKS